ncbi:MAG: hypothetical protein GY953_54405 [bacterium]|nr:hypothetical protein [bacterium]
MRSCSALAHVGLGLLVSFSSLEGAGKEKKEKEPRTQTLEVLPDPPPAVTAETARLVFGVAPARTQGLLSRQVRDSLKSMLKSSRRAQIVKLRAFVAGSGDTRRVQAVVSEVFANNKKPLPTLSVIQVGKLPTPGAQVILEYVAEHRKPQNPHGIAFLSGYTATSEQPTLAVAGLVREALGKLRSATDELGLAPEDLLRVTCFCSSLDDGPQVRVAMREAFPGAALNHVQLRRVYTQGSVTCDAEARLNQAVGEPLRVVKLSGPGDAGERSDVALVGAKRVVFTGAQLAFRWEDTDIRLAYERLGRILGSKGTSYAQVAKSNIYPISLKIADKIRSLGSEFFSSEQPPASTLVELEGLPSLDASFGLDVVAVRP